MQSPKNIKAIAFISMFFAFPICNAATDSDVHLANGNALLAVCGDYINSVDRGGTLSEKDVVMAATCTSYIRGFSHGVSLISTERKESKGYCINESVSALQIARVLVEYLRDNPQILHFHAAILTGRALRTGFPCR